MCESDRIHCMYASETATDFDKRLDSRINQAVDVPQQNTKQNNSLLTVRVWGATLIHPPTGREDIAGVPPCLHSTDQQCNYSRRPTLLNSNCPVHRTCSFCSYIETSRTWWIYWFYIDSFGCNYVCMCIYCISSHLEKAKRFWILHINPSII